MVVLIDNYAVNEYPEFLQFGLHKYYIENRQFTTIWPINGGGMIYYLERY